MSERRVTFFAINDMSIPFYLDKVREVVDAYDPTDVDRYDLNDILELEHTVKFIESKLFHVDWTEEYRNEMVDKARKMRGTVAKYFKNISKDDLSVQLPQLDREYIDNFVHNFVNYKVIDKVTEAEFEAMFNDSSFGLKSLLESEGLVKAYPDLVKKLFLVEPKNIELLLGIFTRMHNKKKLYIPTIISKDEMRRLCMDYVASDDANANYLDVLYQPMKGIEKYMQLSAVDKVTIKKRIDQLHQELFGNLEETGFRIGLAIFESKASYDKEKETAADTDMIGYVDSSWIEDNHDFPSLWNLIKYDEEIFSAEMISMLPSFVEEEMGIMERHLGVQSENSYEIGQYFNMKQQYVVGKVRMIAEILKRHDLDIESMIDWFFKTYSPEEYGVEWLKFDMPSKGEKPSNKTSTLFRIEESLRTQFSVLQANGTIESDIVKHTNTPNLKDLGSLGSKKYVYLADSDEAQSIVNLLFSSQSSITYIDKSRTDTSFVRLMHFNELTLDDFHEHQKPRVQYLIDHGIIETMEDGKLYFTNPEEMYAYKMLFVRGVINYQNTLPKVKIAVDKMIKQKRAVVVDSLYSKPEYDYLNFILNNKVYDNSWAIRNAYQHGTPDYSDDKFLFDYYLALTILIMAVIKIDDDLRLRKLSNK